MRSNGMILRNFWGIGDEDFLGKAVGGGVGSAEGLSLKALYWYDVNGWCFFGGYWMFTSDTWEKTASQLFTALTRGIFWAKSIEVVGNTARIFGVDLSLFFFGVCLSE